jgi:hypothetical protein
MKLEVVVQKQVMLNSKHERGEHYETLSLPPATVQLQQQKSSPTNDKYFLALKFGKLPYDNIAVFPACSIATAMKMKLELVAQKQAMLNSNTYCLHMSMITFYMVMATITR